MITGADNFDWQSWVAANPNHDALSNPSIGPNGPTEADRNFLYTMAVSDMGVGEAFTDYKAPTASGITREQAEAQARAAGFSPDAGFGAAPDTYVIPADQVQAWDYFDAAVPSRGLAPYSGPSFARAPDGYFYDPNRGVGGNTVNGAGMQVYNTGQANAASYNAAIEAIMNGGSASGIPGAGPVPWQQNQDFLAGMPSGIDTSTPEAQRTMEALYGVYNSGGGNTLQGFSAAPAHPIMNMLYDRQDTWGPNEYNPFDNDWDFQHYISQQGLAAAPEGPRPGSGAYMYAEDPTSIFSPESIAEYANYLQGTGGAQQQTFSTQGSQAAQSGPFPQTAGSPAAQSVQTVDNSAFPTRNGVATGYWENNEYMLPEVATQPYQPFMGQGGGSTTTQPTINGGDVGGIIGNQAIADLISQNPQFFTPTRNYTGSATLADVGIDGMTFDGFSGLGLGDLSFDGFNLESLASGLGEIDPWAAASVAGSLFGPFGSGTFIDAVGEIFNDYSQGEAIRGVVGDGYKPGTDLHSGIDSWLAKGLSGGLFGMGETSGNQAVRVINDAWNSSSNPYYTNGSTAPLVEGMGGDPSFWSGLFGTEMTLADRLEIMGNRIGEGSSSYDKMSTSLNAPNPGAVVNDGPLLPALPPMVPSFEGPPSLRTGWVGDFPSGGSSFYV